MAVKYGGNVKGPSMKGPQKVKNMAPKKTISAGMKTKGMAKGIRMHAKAMSGDTDGDGN